MIWETAYRKHRSVESVDICDVKKGSTISPRWWCCLSLDFLNAGFWAEGFKQWAKDASFCLERFGILFYNSLCKAALLETWIKNRCLRMDLMKTNSKAWFLSWLYCRKLLFWLQMQWHTKNRGFIRVKKRNKLSDFVKTCLALTNT